MTWRPRRVLLLAAAALALTDTAAVDRSKFRTCEKTQFCNKFRNVQREPLAAQLQVARDSVTPDADAKLVRFLVEDAAQRGGVALEGSLTFVLGEDKARVPSCACACAKSSRTRRTPRRAGRATTCWCPPRTRRALRQVTAAEAGLKTPVDDKDVLLFAPEGDKPQVVAALKLGGTFGVDLYLDGEKAVSTNDDGLFHYEIRQDRADAEAQADAAADQAAVDAHGGKTIVDYGEDGLAIYDDGTVQKKEEHSATTTATVGADGKVEGWEESFGGHTDKKKFGPSSIGLDVSFHGSAAAPRTLYGIPEHATDFALKDTIEADEGASRRARW